MDDKIMAEINELSSSFDKVNDDIIKGFIWNTLSFLKKEYPLNKEIMVMYHDINTKVDNDFINIKKRELEWKDQMKDFLKGSELFWEENIPQIEKVFSQSSNFLVSLEENNLLFILESFLEDLDKEFLAFYLKMKREKRLIIGHDNMTIHTSIDNYTTLVFVNGFHNLRDLFILCHELRHAYYIYVNKIKIYSSLNILNHIKGEIPAKIMEIKFIEYLAHNMVIEPSLILQNEFDANMLEASLKRNYYDALRYLIASYIAKNMNRSIRVTDYFQKIYDDNVYSLILNIGNPKEKGKIFVK